MGTPRFLSYTFKYADSLTVLWISLLTAVVCETISYFVIHRSSSYRHLRSSIDKASKKLDSLKKPSASASSKNTKKIDRFESSIKESNRDLSLFKFKSGFVVAIVLLLVFSVLNSMFEGKVVAKLPFHPFWLVYKMSHRGLQGYDETDCSMAFLYFLCSFSIRTNLQKLLGFSPPLGVGGGGYTGLFPMPDPKSN